MLKNPHTIWEELGMKFPVLWLSFVSVWVGTGVGEIKKIWTDSGCLEHFYMLKFDVAPQCLK